MKTVYFISKATESALRHTKDGIRNSNRAALFLWLLKNLGGIFDRHTLANQLASNAKVKKVLLRRWNGAPPFVLTYVNSLICYHGNSKDKHFPLGSFAIRELFEHNIEMDENNPERRIFTAMGHRMLTLDSCLCYNSKNVKANHMAAFSICINRR